MKNQILHHIPAIIVPGWQNSSAEHWQTLWASKYGWKRVWQESWLHPDKASWVENLKSVIDKSGAPVFLITHSLGCTVLAHLVNQYSSLNIQAAFMVSPPDLSQAQTPDEIKGFSPIPAVQFPFPSMVVGSTTDPFASFEKMKAMAQGWGSQITNIGDKQHIGDSANLGDWPEGEKLLLKFVQSTY
jgi:predicted alpha/beta hydrolase family esterase